MVTLLDHLTCSFGRTTVVQILLFLFEWFIFGFYRCGTTRGLAISVTVLMTWVHLCWGKCMYAVFICVSCCIFVVNYGTN